MKKILKLLLSYFDLRIISKSKFGLLDNHKLLITLLLASRIDRNLLGEYFDAERDSCSQFCQDLFTLTNVAFKKNGFFVELGGSNGIDLSNTFLLEKKFNWKGIIAEPAKIWHSSLKKNRSAIIEKKCVWKESSETILFNEVFNDETKGELSTIDYFSNSDMHHKVRNLAGNKYKVKTISLSDMLKKYRAPKKIDYLSIDTEGSEYEILKSFNFNEYKISVITCEHNYTKQREKIYSLLTQNGYKRKHVDLSECDDWYVLN